jgi:hypothetical protein
VQYIADWLIYDHNPALVRPDAPADHISGVRSHTILFIASLEDQSIPSNAQHTAIAAGYDAFYAHALLKPPLAAPARA